MKALRQYVPQSLQPLARSAYLRFGEATPSLRMDPSFLVIGGQRCGTTSLFKALAQHPQVLRPAVEKGTDYFTLYSYKDLKWYRGHFPLDLPSHLRSGKHKDAVAFEACTYYMFHPFALGRISEAFPRIKLVAMLRNPIERAYSAYKHEFGRGFETEPDFCRALDLEDARLHGETERMRVDPTYESFAHRHHAYRQRGEFAEQLERAFAHFDRSQIHVMESERFFEEPAKEYAALCEFLGLESFTPARFDQHNARPSSAMPEEARKRLTDHYAGHDERLTQILGRPPRWA